MNDHIATMKACIASFIVTSKRTVLNQEEWNDEKSNEDVGIRPPRKKRRYDVLSIICSSSSGSAVPLKLDSSDDEGGSSSFDLITHTPHDEKKYIKQFYIPPTYQKVLGLILLGNEAKEEEETFFSDKPNYRFILGTKGVGKSGCLTFICSMLLQLMNDKPTSIEELIDNQTKAADDVNNDGNWKVFEYDAAYGYQQKKVNKILFVSCSDKLYEFFQRTNNGGQYRSEMGEYKGTVEDLARELGFEFAVSPNRERREQALRNWLLLDPQNTRDPLHQRWQSNVVIATSMDEDTCIQGIASTDYPRRYYLGPYSEDQYKVLIKSNTDNNAVDDNIEQCWKLYGGIPRHYFKREYEDEKYDLVKNRLKGLLTQNDNGFDLVERMDIFGAAASSRNERHPTENTGLKLLNMVIHMIPDTNLTDFTLKVVNPTWLHFLRTEFKRVEYTRYKKTFHILYNRQNIHEVHDQLIAQAPLFDIPKFFKRPVSIGGNNQFSWNGIQEIIDPSKVWETAEANSVDIFRYLPEDNVADPIKNSINFKDKLSRYVKVFKCTDNYPSYDQVYLFKASTNKTTAYLVNSTCLRDSSKGKLSHSLILLEVFSAIKELRNHYEDIKYVMAVRNMNEVRDFRLDNPHEVNTLKSKSSAAGRRQLAKDVSDNFIGAFPDAATVDLKNESVAIKSMAEHLINSKFLIMVYTN